TTEYDRAARTADSAEGITSHSEGPEHATQGFARMAVSPGAYRTLQHPARIVDRPIWRDGGGDHRINKYRGRSSGQIDSESAESRQDSWTRCHGLCRIQVRPRRHPRGAVRPAQGNQLWHGNDLRPLRVRRLE